MTGSIAYSLPVEEEVLPPAMGVWCHPAEGVEVVPPEVVREEQRHLVQQPEAQTPDGSLLLPGEGRLEGDVTPLQALHVTSEVELGGCRNGRTLLQILHVTSTFRAEVVNVT